MDGYYRQMYKEAKFSNEAKKSNDQDSSALANGVDSAVLKTKEEEIKRVKEELNAVNRDFEDLRWQGNVKL